MALGKRKRSHSIAFSGNPLISSRWSCDSYALPPWCLLSFRDLMPEGGRVPVSCGSFGNLKTRVQCPHFSTCLRGFCHGPRSLFLPVGADCSCVAVPHAPLHVAQRPRHVPADTRAHTSSAQAPPRAHPLCGLH